MEEGKAVATRLLVALDVDGTIVGYDGAISARVHAAVRAVCAAGHHVVLSTGRAIASTLPVAAALDLTGGYSVCSNGATTLRLDRDGPAMVDSRPFDPGPVIAALPGRRLAVELPGSVTVFRATAGFPVGELPGQVHLVASEELGAYGAIRLLAHDRTDMERVVARLGLSCVVDHAGTAEVLAAGVSKASALEALRVMLGVPAADTVAVGDHLNDLPMLRWAARGIAMGHAPGAVRSAAAEVTLSHRDDGLAIVLEPIGNPR